MKEQLRCSPVADALLLSCPKADSYLYYAMVTNQEDQSIAWHKVVPRNMDTVGINTKVTTFDLLLMSMGSHNRDPPTHTTSALAIRPITFCCFFGSGGATSRPSASAG